VTTGKILDGTVAVADLNFAGTMTTNTGLVVRDGTQFYNKTCSGNEALIWSVANGWICSAVVLTDKVGSNTTNYLSKWNGSALVTSTVFDNGTNVGVGTGSPRASLEVNGTIISRAPSAAGSSTIDFSTGNLQYTASSCGAFIFNNLKDGGSYSFAVKGATSATCSFTMYSDVATTALTVHMPPDHDATIASKHTMYTILVMGTDAYVSWVPGL
jgi:hypothetical protein